MHFKMVFHHLTGVCLGFLLPVSFYKSIRVCFVHFIYTFFSLHIVRLFSCLTFSKWRAIFAVLLFFFVLLSCFQFKFWTIQNTLASIFYNMAMCTLINAEWENQHLIQMTYFHRDAMWYQLQRHAFILNKYCCPLLSQYCHYRSINIGT